MENQHAISSQAQYLLLNMPFILRGRMIPSEFERLVNRDRADGKTPFFVNATAGTTVTGSYDPINAIADVAEKHGMWLHVDVSSECCFQKLCLSSVHPMYCQPEINAAF